MIKVLFASFTSAQCFPKSSSKLPKLLNYFEAENTNYKEQFYAVDGTDDFAIFGGRSTSKLLSDSDKDDTLALIVRMDLELNTRRWAKIVNGSGEKTGIV